MSTAVGRRGALPILAIVGTGAMTSGCEAIGTIFKAGVWTGVVAVVVVIMLVVFLATRVGRS